MIDTLTHIYVLKDPTTREVRYIGKSNKPKQRYRRHLYEAKKLLNPTNKRNIWINTLLKKGKKPIMEIIDIVSKNNWVSWERQYIYKYRKQWINLTNETNNLNIISKEILKKILKEKLL